LFLQDNEDTNKGIFMYRAQSSVKLHVQIVVDLPQKDGNGLYLCLKDETQISIG
jgi:hypothetical protein